MMNGLATAPLGPQPSVKARHEAWAYDLDDDYDVLLTGLKTGQFGGVPCDTPAAAALVETLRLLNWPLSYRRFAGAVAHYPETFGLSEARAALQRLGYHTEEDRVLGSNLGSIPLGSFVIQSADTFYFLQLGNAGKLVLFDPATHKTRRIRKGKTYQCILVTAGPDESKGSVQKAGWISSVFARFGTENRAILALTFLSNTIFLLASLSIGTIFDQVLPAKALDTLVFLILGVGLLLYFDLRLRQMKSQIVARVSARLEFILSSTLYEKLLSFRLEMLRGSPVNEQMHRLKQFESVRDYYGTFGVSVLFELPFVLLLLIAISLINIPIALFLAAVLVIYIGVGVVAYPHINRHSKDMVSLKAECMRLREETINQRTQLVQRGLGTAWSARLSPKFRKLHRARQGLESVWRALSSFVTISTPLATGGVICIGAVQVISGDLTGGALLACTILAARTMSPVQQTLILAVRLPEILGQVRQIDAMMRITSDPSKRQIEPDLYTQAFETPPDINLDGLVVRYPRSISPALLGLTARFDKGELICLTGPSGAGKSTLLTVLTGHYRPQSGSAMIGSYNIEQLNSDERTDLIGHLGHKSLQIHGTLAQNLRLTRPEATEEELESICAEVGLLAQINEMPNGFETRLTDENRALLSPAFRTKFAVAQLLLKAPKVLLLDEPEAGLSNADEASLMQAIRARRDRMTTVMVTHRPSLMRQADKVLELNHGQVKFFGPPQDARTAQT